MRASSGALAKPDHTISGVCRLVQPAGTTTASSGLEASSAKSAATRIASDRARTVASVSECCRQDSAESMTRFGMVAERGFTHLLLGFVDSEHFVVFVEDFVFIDSHGIHAPLNRRSILWRLEGCHERKSTHSQYEPELTLFGFDQIPDFDAVAHFPALAARPPTAKVPLRYRALRGAAVRPRTRAWRPAPSARLRAESRQGPGIPRRAPASGSAGKHTYQTAYFRSMPCRSRLDPRVHPRVCSMADWSGRSAQRPESPMARDGFASRVTTTRTPRQRTDAHCFRTKGHLTASLAIRYASCQHAQGRAEASCSPRPASSDNASADLTSSGHANVSDGGPG